MRLAQVLNGPGDRIAGQLEVRNNEDDVWRKVCRRTGALAFFTLGKLGTTACKDLGYAVRVSVEAGKRGNAGNAGWNEIFDCTPNNNGTNTTIAADNSICICLTSEIGSLSASVSEPFLFAVLTLGSCVTNLPDTAIHRACSWRAHVHCCQVHMCAPARRLVVIPLC